VRTRFSRAAEVMESTLFHPARSFTRARRASVPRTSTPGCPNDWPRGDDRGPGGSSARRSGARHPRRPREAASRLRRIWMDVPLGEVLRGTAAAQRSTRWAAPSAAGIARRCTRPSATSREHDTQTRRARAFDPRTGTQTRLRWGAIGRRCLRVRVVVRRGSARMAPQNALASETYGSRAGVPCRRRARARARRRGVRRGRRASGPTTCTKRPYARHRDELSRGERFLAWSITRVLDSVGSTVGTSDYRGLKRPIMRSRRAPPDVPQRNPAAVRQAGRAEQGRPWGSGPLTPTTARRASGRGVRTGHAVEPTADVEWRTGVAPTDPQAASPVHAASAARRRARTTAMPSGRRCFAQYHSVGTWSASVRSAKSGYPNPCGGATDRQRSVAHGTLIGRPRGPTIPRVRTRECEKEYDERGADGVICPPARQRFFFLWARRATARGGSRAIAGPTSTATASRGAGTPRTARRRGVGDQVARAEPRGDRDAGSGWEMIDVDRATRAGGCSW